MIKQRVQSNTDPGKYYDVEENAGRWSCNCVAGGLNKICRHIRRVMNGLDAGTEQLVNELLVQVTRGRAPIARPLSLGQEVKLFVTGTVIKREEEDNHDGSFNVIFKVKAITIEDVETAIEKLTQKQNAEH
jgi:hypothetical protein